MYQRTYNSIRKSKHYFTLSNTKRYKFHDFFENCKSESFEFCCDARSVLQIDENVFGYALQSLTLKT